VENQPSYKELQQQIEVLQTRNKSQLILDCAGVMFVELNTEGIVSLVNSQP